VDPIPWLDETAVKVGALSPLFQLVDSELKPGSQGQRPWRIAELRFGSDPILQTDKDLPQDTADQSRHLERERLR
jgi:hypothetical protein